jgi:hypothetical protein
MQLSKWELFMLWVAAQICRRFGHVYEQTEEVYTPSTAYETYTCLRCEHEWGSVYY